MADQRARVGKPSNCIVDPKKGLMYTQWADGHQSLIPLAAVRAACPCIACKMVREDFDPLRTLSAEQATPSTVPVGVQELGNHALQITWQDGHNAGLYPWALLRGLCPCDQCQPARRP